MRLRVLCRFSLLLSLLFCSILFYSQVPVLSSFRKKCTPYRISSRTPYTVRAHIHVWSLRCTVNESASWEFAFIFFVSKISLDSAQFSRGLRWEYLKLKRFLLSSQPCLSPDIVVLCFVFLFVLSDHKYVRGVEVEVISNTDHHTYRLDEAEQTKSMRLESGSIGRTNELLIEVTYVCTRL